MFELVASEHRRPLLDVAGDPFSATLYTVLLIMDRRRADGIRARSERVETSRLAAIAWHDPKQLAREANDVRSDIQSPRTRKGRQSRAHDLRAAGLALAERIESSGVLDDTRRN